MKLSVIVIFYNNVREADRTLYTLSRNFQKNITGLEYEVLAIDSGSTERLSKDRVLSFGQEFDYYYVESKHPSPVEALRYGIQKAKGEYIMMMIDGAHMLSPGILSNWSEAANLHPDSFVFTQRYHLGKYKQNDSFLLGYNQEQEDLLLDSIDWKNDGYQLFYISDYKQSPEWWYSYHFESNCFILKKDKLLDYGCLAKNYFSTGGGLLNHDIYSRATNDPDNKCIMLLGESTFHQFHGGVSTNVSRNDVVMQEYKSEFRELNGYNYQFPDPPYVIYYGGFDNQIKNFAQPTKQYTSFFTVSSALIENNKVELAQEVLEAGIAEYPYNIGLVLRLSRIYKNLKKLDMAMGYVDRALLIKEKDTPSLLLKAEILLEKGELDKALELYEGMQEINPEEVEISLQKIKVHILKNQVEEAEDIAGEIICNKQKLNNFHTFLKCIQVFDSRNLYAQRDTLMDSDLHVEDRLSNLSYHYLSLKLGKSTIDDLEVVFYAKHRERSEIYRFGNLLLGRKEIDRLHNLVNYCDQKKEEFFSNLLQAKYHCSIDDWNKALTYGKKNIDSKMGPLYQTENLKVMANIFIFFKDYKTGLEHIEEAERLIPNDEYVKLIKARILDSMDENELAMSAFKEIYGSKNPDIILKSICGQFDVAFKLKDWRLCHEILTAAESKPVKKGPIEFRRKKLKNIENH